MVNSSIPTVVSPPCGAAFHTVVGTTPVTFEFRGSRWCAVAGRFGLVEIWGDSYAAVREAIDVLYGKDAQCAA